MTDGLNITLVYAGIFMSTCLLGCVGVDADMQKIVYLDCSISSIELARYQRPNAIASTALIDLPREEIAVVLMHEFAHEFSAFEDLADERGLMMMAEKGYNPEAAVAFWTRYYDSIGWWEGDGTHPKPEERIAHLKALMPKAKAIYEKAVAEHGKGDLNRDFKFVVEDANGFREVMLDFPCQNSTTNNPTSATKSSK